MGRRMIACCGCLLLGCLALPPAAAARSEDGPSDVATIESARAEVARLRAELEAVRAENAALRARLDAATPLPATRPATTRATTGPAPTRYELGETTATLAGYQFRTPVGWSAGPKDDKSQVLFRSPDKQSVVLVRVKAKGGMGPELQAKFAHNAVQMLKQDFVKNKAEVIEPPVVVADPRFYLRVRERIRIKGEKSADQTHLYQMPGKDMVEVTVITTSEVPEQVAASRQLAEEMLLSLKPGK